MINPSWKLLPKLKDSDIQVVFREWPDGRQESCLVTAEEYLKWLAEGNTPLPADDDSGQNT
jgi:hypothetical protein